MIEPAQPHPIWCTDRKPSSPPEVRLIYTIIKHAWHDLNSADPYLRRSAKAWFHSKWFNYYCHLLNLDPELARDKFINPKENNDATSIDR